MSGSLKPGEWTGHPPGNRLQPLSLMVAQVRQSLTDGMKALHAGNEQAALSFFWDARIQAGQMVEMTAGMTQEDDHAAEG